MGNFTTVTDRQLSGFGNLWFYTFIKDLCLEKCYSIYLVKIIQQSIHKMWKNNNIILQLNQWKLCVGYPQTVHDPSCCWQHKSCYSNILLVCLSWPSVRHNPLLPLNYESNLCVHSLHYRSITHVIPQPESILSIFMDTWPGYVVYPHSVRLWMFAQCGSSSEHSGYDPLNKMIPIDTYSPSMIPAPIP